MNSTFVKTTCAIIALVCIAGFSGQVKAQSYSPGSEGIKPILPPPGAYYIMYNQYYKADTLNDDDGNKINNGFDINTFANVHRFLWVTNKKILGGVFAMDLIIPLVNINLEVKAAGIDSNNFNLGDVNIEPFVLEWAGNRYNAGCSLSMYLPTGDYSVTEPASIGKDHYTFMLTSGLTVYPDAEKLWSVSALTRYEKHFENDALDIKYGDDFTVDWGIGRKINLFDVGISGYAHWQLNNDTGDAATADNKDRVYAIGPEVQMAIPSLKGAVKLKYYNEFGAKNTNEGDALWLVFAKAF